MNTLPQNLQSRLDRELDEGESINWSAQPSLKILMRDATSNGKSAVFIALFSSVGLAIIGVFDHLEWLGSEDPTPSFFYVCAGFALSLGFVARHLMRMAAKYTANNTIYAITNKRAIIITINKDKSITQRDYRADELIHLARTEFPDGSGTLTLESARGAGTSNQVAVRHQLRALENVLEVERLLRTQFGNA